MTASWHNHTYSNSFLTPTKNVLQGTGYNSCFLIPTKRPLMFFVDKTVYAGDVTVSVEGDRLECVPQTCPITSMLVAQTESSCNTDGRSSFCGLLKRCTPNTDDSNSCTFTCKCETAPMARLCSIRIAVYFRLGEKATLGTPSELCRFDVYARSPTIST